MLAEGQSQLELLLANRILTAWPMTMAADASYVRWTAQGGTFKKGEYHQKRLDRASGNSFGPFTPSLPGAAPTGPGTGSEEF